MMRSRVDSSNTNSDDDDDDDDDDDVVKKCSLNFFIFTYLNMFSVNF